MKRLAHRVCGPAILVGLLIMSLLCGCRHSSDPSLVAADSLMEEHPDSALMMLNEYPSGTPTSEADSAYHALLLTHARYKNFIDETDDSLISSATDYFLDHNDKGKASRALFLQGMIRMNANRLGEAAVSFRKGLDIAREGKQYMWEGQCARGLCMLYGELYNGSAQVAYAKQSYDAFMKAGDDGWIAYSKLDLARALNNNSKQDESLALMEELFVDAESLGDSLILTELYQLKGLVLFALCRYAESVEFYEKAYELNPSVLTVADFRNIAIASAEIRGNASEIQIPLFEKASEIMEESTNPFAILAMQGKYKDAYERLERYRVVQDSVLSVIFSNTVSESIGQYETGKENINKEKTKNERLLFSLAVLIMTIGGILVIGYLREQRHQEEVARIKTEADLENLRADFQLQLKHAEMLTARLSEYSNKEEAEGFEEIIRRHYAETNRLCDEYYQGLYNKKDKEKVKAEIDNIMKSFTEQSQLDEIIGFVDEKSGGLYSAFRKTFFGLNEEEYRLFLYLMLGFNARSISIFLDQKISAVYNKKSRLKAKIMQGNALNRDCYLKFF